MEVQVMDERLDAEALVQLIQQLSEADQKAIEAIIERFVLAHDKDYTMLTPKERKELDEAERDTEYVTLEQLEKELGLDL